MDADELARRARDLVVEEAVAERRRRAGRRAAADELADLATVLAAAAERRAEIALTLLGGQRLVVIPATVGVDVVAGARPGTPTEVVPLAAVAVADVPAGLRTDPDTEPDGPTLADLLHAVVDERPPVAIWTVDGTGPVSGDLVACGEDVLFLAGDGRPMRRLVRLDAVARLRLAP